LVAKKNNKPGATPKTFLEGSIFLAQGDRTNAQKCFQLAQPAFETTVGEAPESADQHANLGWLYVSAICLCPTARASVCDRKVSDIAIVWEEVFCLHRETT
jgi:hypothetical protein